jgi:hypothetical protein
MRRIHILIAIVTLTAATAASAVAQTITSYDDRGARTGLRVGYGGHGLDWDASIESPLLADVVRVRGSVGQGLWSSEFDSAPDPRVTRLAASALVFFRPRHAQDDLRPYVGIGRGAYIPRGADSKARTGTRLIAGLEGSGERWTVGVEIEIDLPRPHHVRPSVGGDLFPDGRIGMALRRRF